MIQATELRLNNYVKYNGIIMSVSGIESPKPRKEKRFDGKYLIELFDGTGFITATQDELGGIELTEEILFKCGFELTKTKDILHMRLNKNYFEYSLVSSHLSINGMDLSLALKNVNYIHKLQNIVHALTNTELKINLRSK